MSATQVYFILGAGDAGRTELAQFLVSRLQEEGQTACWRSLLRQPAGDFAVPGAAVPPGETLLLLGDGRADPLDQIEWLKAALAREGWELARILTVIDCALLHAQPHTHAWFDACTHFSDVLLLGHREELPKKWVHDFETKLEKLHLPALRAYLKKGGKVEHPGEILFPEARRVSQFFDAPEAPDAATPDFPEVGSLAGVDDDTIFTDEAEEDFGDTPQAEAPWAENEPLPGDAQSDLWLARDDHGRRRKRVPDICEFLS